MHEVYGNEWFGEEHLVESGRASATKALGQSETSSIIHRCWHGSFDTSQQLWAMIMALEEGKKQTTWPMSAAAIPQTAASMHAAGKPRHPQQDPRPTQLVLHEVILSTPA
jgi:hypothetical protein